MKNILIVVDIQRGFIVNEMTEEAMRRIDLLLSCGAFDAVAASKYKNSPDNPIVSLMGWDKLMSDDEQKILGKAGEKLDFCAEKSKFSAATPKLYEWLKNECDGEYPETVYLVGVDTECCVLSTAVDLFEEGIRPIILSDYCASSGGEEYHNAGILSLHHLIGKNNIYQGEITSRENLADAYRLSQDVSKNSDYSYGTETDVVNLLIAKNMHISFSESCTGGLCAGRLVNVPDASRVFDASFVTYANEAKIKYLGVSADTIEKYGVVSEEVAGEMARGTAMANSAQVGVGVSGIAGPSGATKNKPVGMVCFGFYIDGKVLTFTKQFGHAGRNSVRRMSVDFVFNTLLRLLSQMDK